MRHYFEFVWSSEAVRFDAPVTHRRLDQLYGGILYNHITQNVHDTYVSLSPGSDFGRVSFRLSFEENIQELFTIDKRFVLPLGGLSLHLGGLPCDLTSYRSQEEIKFRIIVRFRDEFYRIPCDCGLKKGIYETVRLQFYRAEKGLREGSLG